MGKENKEKNSGPAGTGNLLIYVNLPPPTIAENTLNNPILLRHLVAHRLRNLLWINYGEMKEKALGQCSCIAIPKARRSEKSGEVTQTKMPGHIEIHSYVKDGVAELQEAADGDHHGYYGLQRCASAMRCPTCGARIRKVRRDEIAMISKAMIHGGYSFIFQTLTAPHDFKTEPSEFIKLFQEANRQLKKTNSWKLFANRWKITHYIRAVEVTDDKFDSDRKTGIHFHSHSIIFSELQFFTEKDTMSFKKELAALWFRALKKVGIATDKDKAKILTRGVDVKRPSVRDQGELSDPALIEKLVEYVCKGASFEMSPTTITGKEGKKQRRVSHWELMRYALLENADAQPRLLSILKALKGIAHLYFSPGLKQFCGLNDVTDDEIMLGKKEKKVYAFDDIYKKKQWQGIKKHGYQKTLLIALDESANIPVKFLVEMAAGGVDPITGEVVASSP